MLIHADAPSHLAAIGMDIWLTYIIPRIMNDTRCKDRNAVRLTAQQKFEHVPSVTLKLKGH